MLVVVFATVRFQVYTAKVHSLTQLHTLVQPITQQTA